MLSLIAFFTAVTQPPTACDLLYPVAPNETAAKRIAAAAIASRPPDALPKLFKKPGKPIGYNGQPYTLDASANEDGTAWNIEVYSTPRRGLRTLSPVYAMVIDQCSGAVLRFGISF